VTTAETRAACLDAETLAAWMDGSLSRSELASAEAHAATCARCQAMVAAMAKTAPQVVQPERSWRRFLVPVLVPATALLALAVWAARPDQPLDQLGTPTQMTRADESDRELRDQAEASKESTSALESAAPVPPPARTQNQNPQTFQMRKVPRPSSPANTPEAKPTEAPAAVAAPAPPAIAPAPPPANAVRLLERKEIESYSETVAQSAARAGGAALDVVAPEPSPGWRLKNDRIERSTDGGASWSVAYSEADAGLIALSSPSPDVCWVVGRGGIVLLTADGRTWKRVPFPKTGDLVSVLASDASNAVVFSSEGTVWVTKNGGQTWEVPRR
jgi:hypothetical protein